MTEQQQPGLDEFQIALAEQHAAEEVEVWTGAYSIRMFLPAFLALLPISAALYAVARAAGADDHNNVLRYSLEGLLLLGWFILLGVACNKVLGTEYMLTNKRLYCRRGFGHPGREGVDLVKFLDVRVIRSPLERWLGAGRISLSVAPTAGQPFILAGVLDPERVANIFRKQIRAAHPVKH